MSWRRRLELMHGQLSGETDGYRIHLRHLLPDVALLGYLIDVLENSHATWLLSDSNAPRAGIVTARAAFEAALYSLRLVADREAYDHNGSLIRACELLENEELLERRNKASAAIGLPQKERGLSPEQIMAADATSWAAEFHEAPTICAAALTDCTKDKRWKRHWTGDRSWREFVISLAEALGDRNAAFVSMADALYGAESLQSHPRPRFAYRKLAVTADGRLGIGPRDGDGDFGAALASMACELASIALRRRRSFDEAVAV